MKLTLTLKNFIPIRRDIMLCVVFGAGSLANKSCNSVMNFFLTDMNLDWAKVPITSAYRSATICILAALGPVCSLKERYQVYLKHRENIMSQYIFKTTYPSRYLKCLNAIASMCPTKSSWPGWNDNCFNTSIKTKQKINSTARSRLSWAISDSLLSVTSLPKKKYFNYVFILAKQSIL